MTNKEIAQQIAQQLGENKCLRSISDGFLTKTSEIIENIIDENFLDEDEEINKDNQIVKIKHENN